MVLRAGLVVVAGALLLAGCGGGSERYKTAPVSGRVTLDSKPLASATVVFVPVVGKGDKEPLPSSVGVTTEDGRYSLVFEMDSKTTGAVVGKHKVVITLGAAGGSQDSKPTFHKQLPEKYNRRTDLKCDVPAEGRNDANFDLKSR
jgi:hypothetical protein